MINNKSPFLILASASPRRKQLLEQLGVPFLQKSLDTPEETDDTAPQSQVERLALAKLDAWLTAFPNEAESPILTADTTVDLDGRMVGKAEKREEAREMVSSLAGRSHRVITALALHSPSTGTVVETEITEVQFAPLSKLEIEWYLATDEWKGVAGAYRIQERGAFLVKGIKGCYYNVMGLPLRLLYGMLKDTVPELFSYPD